MSVVGSPWSVVRCIKGTEHGKERDQRSEVRSRRSED